jgi:general secretion pathway protein G
MISRYRRRPKDTIRTEKILGGKPMKNIENKRKRVNRNGFTLIELLVVMVILAMLAALVGPRLFGHVGKASQKTARTQIEMLGQGLDAYRLDTGRYPSTSEGLEALMNNNGVQGWDGPYLKKAIPTDPWRNPYHYQSPGSHGEYDLYSYGADGAQGGEGENQDINSWE